MPCSFHFHHKRARLPCRQPELSSEFLSKWLMWSELKEWRWNKRNSSFIFEKNFLTVKGKSYWKHAVMKRKGLRIKFNPYTLQFWFTNCGLLFRHYNCVKQVLSPQGLFSHWWSWVVNMVRDKLHCLDVCARSVCPKLVNQEVFEFASLALSENSRIVFCAMFCSESWVGDKEDICVIWPKGHETHLNVQWNGKKRFETKIRVK